MAAGTLPGAPPNAASRLFGDGLGRATVFAERLAEEGVLRGMIGPRETGRLWERHILNCAALREAVPRGVSVIDIGSGAGLPGIPLALARPDLAITLIEPMRRRTDWLESVVAELGLTVTVVRGRAEERAVTERLPGADVVTSRALAPLDRLARWSLPLLQRGGTVLALKGANADTEVERHRDAVSRAGGGEPSVLRCGVGVLEQPTRVVRIKRVGLSKERDGQRKRTRRSR